MLGCRNAPSLIYPYLMHAGDHTHARTTNPRLFNSILPWIMHASDTHFDPVEILKRRADDAHTLFCITCEYVCNSPQKKKRETLTLRNRSEVQRTRKHRSPVEPVFIHVFSGCQGTVQPLEQLSQAVGGHRERQPVQ